MHTPINSMIQKIWKKLKNKEYRDSFVAAHISNTVAAQIAMLRKENGWTQAQLAKEAKTHQSRISDLEDPNYENIEIATLRKLASAFDVALTVRFVPFSDIARWVSSLSPGALAVTEFENDGPAIVSNQLSRQIRISSDDAPVIAFKAADDPLQAIELPALDTGGKNAGVLNG